MGYSPQEVADRAEIHDVIVRYGWAIDTKDWALLDTCFSDDAHVDYSSNPGGKVGPYKDVRGWLEKVLHLSQKHMQLFIGVTLNQRAALEHLECSRKPAPSVPATAPAVFTQ